MPNTNKKIARAKSKNEKTEDLLARLREDKRSVLRKQECNKNFG